MYCWTANVAGKNVEVANLLSSRAEPHEYAFTPGDARRLNTARLVIVNGLGLEAWLPKWLASEPNSAPAKLVTVAQGLGGRTMSGVTAGLNPHLWLDPQLACVAVSNIAVALERVDAQNAAAYQSNAAAYVARLQTLDAEIEAGLAGITNRAIVTYHDAFPYFARRYKLEVVGVVEEIPDVNPGPRSLAQLTEKIRTRGIKVLYIEPGSHSSIARRIARDLNISVAELDTIEAGDVKLDAYEKRMRSNLDVLRRTLR